jgi:type IV secretory pathway protease TraF
LPWDGEGRPLPQIRGTYQVLPNQVWLVSRYSPVSYDSRYFGGVPISALQQVAEPVWTWR